MSKQKFEDFIKRQTKEKEEEKIDWNAQKREWINFVGDLYTNIENYLDDFTKTGDINIEYSDVSITEQNIGTYNIRRMTIIIGINKIVLTPIGTLLVGTKGRIDMVGPRGIKRLILADKDSEGMKFIIKTGGQDQKDQYDPNKINWEWKIISDLNRPKYMRLTQESFMDSIMEISNA